ncbi:1-phosphofructokinase family hexose kinase [Arthrobacter sp. KNU-44]|uniref:1-phosphofructokinase family hexose kinase n=1 Tax=Arthrobacter sp. KNU-44 TaxID=3450744 RepID=UPI003F43CFD6
MTPTVITVTPSPAVDATYAVAGLRPGDSHRVPAPVYRAGGKGINVARVAHQLGFPTLAIATAGGPAGEQFARDLESPGMPHRLVNVGSQTRRTVTIVDTVRDETSIFNEEGPALTPEEWLSLDGAVGESLNGRWLQEGSQAGVLVGAGSLPFGAPETFYPSLVDRAHRTGVPVIIDTSGQGILSAARAGADLLKPNNHELIEATGETDLASAAWQLIGLGARRVLLSAGADGMAIFDADAPGSYLRAALPAPLRGNPTGAGDAAVAAAAVAFSQGLTGAEDILRRATAWSAAAVLMPVAGEISPRHLELAEELVVSRH